MDEKFTLHQKMNSAVARCREIHQGEKLMGYADSARTYEQMIDEISRLSIWVLNEFYREAREAPQG